MRLRAADRPAHGTEGSILPRMGGISKRIAYWGRFRVPFPVAGSRNMTLEAWMGASFSIRPPPSPVCGLGLVAFLIMLMPATTTLLVVGLTFVMVPVLP